MWIFIAILFTAAAVIDPTAGQVETCEVPKHFQGQFFSIETIDVDTRIDAKNFENTYFTGECYKRLDDVNSTNADHQFHSRIVFYDRQGSKCYRCFAMYFRSLNINQYKRSDCQTFADNYSPTLEEVCRDVKDEESYYYTFFRINYEIVNCKNTFEGVYNFTYEWNVGGGGICESQYSQIMACQEPGSPYLDNQVFNMHFAKCPDVSTSRNLQIRFYCMGTWTDPDGNVWSGVADIGAEVYRERFRCMLTRYDQEEGDNKQRYTMSWWADCNELKSPYEGPVRLLLQPVVGDFQLAYTEPTCNFPTNYSGHWFHWGEYDVDVDINATHIYFRTKEDEFNYKESYFVCMMNSDTRYLVMAITVGKCEIDYVCFDMLPRHHSIIRWRMGKPYRLTTVELAYPNHESYMFRQACSWYSFTLDRNVIEWNYKTFLLNPPVPMECPIRGRYKFIQSGPESELIKTRIQGITERPRHMIDCVEYVSEFKACDKTPTTITLDAEYCETVDHTGRPIGEYDMADWELTCVGHWDEDWRSYMVTWDPEDPTSAFRCWIYERTDWRYIMVSRSTGATCRPEQRATSRNPAYGASLHMYLEENERLFDDCAQNYVRGNPFVLASNVYDDSDSAAMATRRNMLILILTLIVGIFAVC